MAWPPNGAAAIEAAPVEVSTMRHRGWKPKLARTAMPVTFCETIVTTNSGTPSASTGPGRKSGAVTSSAGARPDAGPRSSGWLTTTATTATTRHAGTAHPGAKRSSSAQVAITGRASSGALSTALNGSRHRGRSTPASIAAASARGIRSTVRPSHGHSPASTSSTPHSRKAATAVANPPSGTPAVASSAAPGVDQAMATGSLVRRASPMLSSPITSNSAISPDAASSAEAPTPRSPASTTANEPAKPTRPATIPAETACPSPGPGSGQRPRHRNARWLTAGTVRMVGAMTSAAAPAPKSQTGLQIHMLIVVLALACLIVQVYLAGRGAFGASSYSAHQDFGHILEPVALVLLIATVAIPATRNKGDIIQAVAFLVLVVVQTVLAEAGADVAAFHPVNALILIGLVSGMLFKDRRVLTGG